MKKSTKTTAITIIVMAIITAVVIFFYFKTTQNVTDEETVAKTEIEKLLKKDMENNYPGTPKEVLKLYGRMTQCLYNDELNQKQIEGLLEQIRKMYDDELLEVNPWDKHLKALCEDILDYRDNKRTIMSYSVQKSSQVKFVKMDNKEYAITYILFMTGDNTSPLIKNCEKFMLRKDSSDNWKIVGWELVDPDTVEIGEY